ncbi:MAG: hypothetical protein EHM64_13680 [Ignavibacteriae bacterium]|nr:MAG: hypothetical protein EHM64_13680 [Ignavibacteriota bacterium]
MNYPVQIDGCDGQTIEVKSPSMFAGPKLLINGQPAPRGPKRNQMVIRRNDGKEIIASWKPQLLGLDMPQIIVEGRIIQVVAPLEWYELVWSGISVLLIFIGGLIGGAIGGLSFSVNTQIFRSSLSTAAKYLATAGVSILAVITYFIVAALFLTALGK